MKSWTAWVLASALGLLGGGVLILGDRSLGAALLASSGAFAAATALQQRVGRLSLACAAARRSDELARTAHELCTPLTSVLTALELVLAGHAVTTREVREFLGEAAHAARHMAAIVNGGLDGSAERPRTRLPGDVGTASDRPVGRPPRSALQDRRRSPRGAANAAAAAGSRSCSNQAITDG